MAEVAPMAEWRPLTRAMSTTPLDHDVICLHTMVGTLAGSWSWSNRPGGTYWHFGVRSDGVCWQLQDLRFRSAANLEGNPYCIPIETSDLNEGVWPTTWAPRPWTQKQLDKIVQLVAWLCVRYDIPPVLIPDTKRGRRGIAYHRQGIVPYLVVGGDKWSNADYKTCPTDPRVNQIISYIIPKVQSLVNGDDMTPDDHAQIKAMVQDENRKFAKWLTVGEGNSTFNPATQTWMPTAVHMPKVWTELGKIKGLVAALPTGVDIDEVVLAQTLAPALLQALNPQQVAEIVADVLGPDIGQQVVEALAAKLAV